MDMSYYKFRPFTRHSLVLLVGGFMIFVYGFVIHTWSPDGPRAASIELALKLAPLGFWGTLWSLTGLLSMVSSIWPVMSEKWGYTLLTAASSGWGAIYLTGLFVPGNSLGEMGGAILWNLIAFLWWATAGLMNPEKVIVVFEPEPTHGDG